MKIDKILNNNVIVSLNEKGEEIIVMGRGLAFQKRVGHTINEENVEKIFTISNKDITDKFKELLSDMPTEYMILSEKIISHTKMKLGKKLNESIYLTLTDHINSTIERYKNGIKLKNALLWDIKRLYKEEFIIGKDALVIIKEDLDIELAEDEAAFIALHIVNAELNEEMPNLMNMTKVMQEVLNIVKYHFKMDFDEESLRYYRFITHLKFFAQRLFNKNTYTAKDDELYEMIRLKYPDAHGCVEKVEKFINEKYTYELTTEEKLYLMIHIERITENK